MSMVYLADKINYVHGKISNGLKEDIAIFYGSSLPDTLGSEYTQVFDGALSTTDFVMGDATRYTPSPSQKTITIARSFDSSNIAMMGNLADEVITSVCVHWSKNEDVLVENRGFATITYKLDNNENLVKTSSVGTGFQEGVESCILSDVMRDNYNNGYTTTNCIYQETVARYFMDSVDSKSAVITGALTGDTTAFETVLDELGTDLPSLLSVTDKLEDQEEARKAGDISPQELQKYYVTDVVPFIQAFAKEATKGMTK